MLPDDIRLSLPLRCLRLFTYLLLMFNLSALFGTNGLRDIHTTELTRRNCHGYCQRSSFPLLECGTKPGLQMNHGGNAYNDLFVYTRPTVDVDDDEYDTLMAGYDNCHYLALRELAEYTWIESQSRYQRLAICFTACRRLSDDVRLLDEETDPRPKCMCQTAVDPSVPQPQQEFWCDDDSAYANAGLMCVSPDGGYDDPLCGSGVCSGSTCICGTNLLLVIFVGNIIQFVMEGMVLYTSMQSDEIHDWPSPWWKCTGQIILITYFTLLIIYSVAPMLLAEHLDKIGAVMLTFFLSVVLDQIKSCMIQPVVWWLIIRRCGRVMPGIQEYSSEYLMQWDLQDSLFNELRMRLRNFLESRRVSLCIMGTIGAYALVVVFNLVVFSIVFPVQGTECMTQPEHKHPPGCTWQVEEKFDEPNFRVLRDAIFQKKYRV